MRTLHADLLAAQRSSSAPVYLQVVLTKAGFTTMTYTTADVYNRIVGIIEEEKQYSGKTTILLDNSDGNFNNLTLDFRGYTVQVGWGFTCAGGVNRYSNSQTLWVVEQTEVSRFGKLLTQLVCWSIWDMLGESRVFAGGVKLGGVVTRTENYNPVGRKIIGDSSGAYGTVTHYQSDELLVSNVVGSFSGETAKIGSDLSIVIDSITILGTDVGGAKQYSGDTHIQDIVASLLSAWVSSPTVDSDDPLNSYTTFMPIYNVYVDAARSIIIQEMLDFTMCGMRMRDSTMHVLYLSDPGTTDYTYDGVHNIAGCDRTRALSFPNRIYVVDCDPYYGSPTWVGSAVDADAYALLGKYIDALVVNPTIQSNAQASALALALINRGKQAVNSGAVILPMINVGQEVLDWVVLTDARNSNLTITGRVGAINRKFENGKLSMSIELGGLRTPSNFRSYPSAVPPPASVGSSDLIQELILATTIYAGSGHVKISPAGLCIIGDADTMADAMIRFVSTSGECTAGSGVAYIWHHEGTLGITCDEKLILTGGGGIDFIGGGNAFNFNGGAIELPISASDPDGMEDGAIYYKYDTDVFRGKANGVWGNLGGSVDLFSARYIVTGSRAVNDNSTFNIVYQNTTGKPKSVNITVVPNEGASVRISAAISTSLSMTVSDIIAAAAGSYYTLLSFIVPAGYYYCATYEHPYNGSLLWWTEVY